MVEEAGQPADSVPARDRRKNNWWEPMFSGTNCDDFKVSDWDFSNNKGPSKLLFRADKISSQRSLRVSDVMFEDCDFQGEFKTQLIFKNCRFKKCDFGLSTFVRAKFTDCDFVDTSFSQCTFENCEFRTCNYSGISFSGNETLLPKTLITEPYKFIFGGKAAVGNLPSGKKRCIQELRFEETRSTLSRSILANLQSEGSEDTYYSAVRTASVCEDRARFAKGALRIITSFSRTRNQNIFHIIVKILSGFLQCFSSSFSLVVLSIMGRLNGWGGNVSRVLLFGIALVSSIAYRMSYKYELPYYPSLIKTTEIFLLFGYTNNIGSTAQDFSLVFSTALCGVFWYALAIPTVVNRLTRIRG